MTTDSTTRLLTGTDPRTGRRIGSGVPEAGPAQALSAARDAAEALRSRPRPGEPGGFDDADLLDAVAAGLEEVTADLVGVAEQETALPTDRLTGEVGRTVAQLRAFAVAARNGLLADAIIDTARSAPAPRPDQRRVARPLGPVAVFSASNFPFAFSTAGGDTASAFAAGCPVVLKAHPDHPATSLLTAEAVSAGVRAAGAPESWFQVLHGGSVELGQALAAAPDIAAVAFTGSLRGGRALFDAAARRDVPIPVFAEMGSLNPVVVTPHALAARGDGIGQLLAGAVLASAGQLCTKPNLVLAVEGPGLQELLDALAAPLRQTPELVMLTARLRDGFDAAWRHLAGADGVVELVPAAALPREGAWESPGLATVAVATLLERPDLLEERFGPGTVVAVARDVDELERLLAAVARLADRHRARRAGGRRRRPGGPGAGSRLRPADLERPAHRRHRRMGDRARRPLPGDHRALDDERRDDGGTPLPAARRVPGLAGRAAASAAARREPARHPPAGGRQLDPGRGPPPALAHGLRDHGALGALAPRLRPVHRVVRELEDVGDAARDLGGVQDADADAHPDPHRWPAQADVDRGGQSLGHAAGDLVRAPLGLLRGVPAAVEQHGELVAADPGHEVGLAHAGPQPLAHGDEQLVAGRVAVAVVDLLEAVEVAEEQRHPAGGAWRQE